MADDLKKKAVSGVSWSFVEQILTRGVNFVIGIILARLLSPTDYGLVGMISVFIAVSQLFIDGGLTSALIRTKDPSEEDFSTVFIINFILSILFYFILFFTAGPIASFYDQPILKPFLRVIALTLIISSFGCVQNTLLTIRIDFKTKSYISVATAILSGAAGIWFAYKGHGVWALAVQSISATFACTLLLIILVKWHPKSGFSKDSFKRLFSFSSKLLGTNLIRTIFDNAYNIVIGKHFSAASLGQYSRANQFPGVVNSTIMSALNRAIFPILSQVQDDDKRLISVYEKNVQVLCFITFPILLWLLGCANPFVHFLLTDKWMECVPLMQIICISLLTTGITNINLNLFFVKGRSDIVLRLEVIKKTIAIIILFGSMFLGLKAMCYGQVLFSIIDFGLNLFYTKKLLHYGIGTQLKAITPYLIFSLVIMVEALVFSRIIETDWLSLSVSAIICPITYLLLAKAAKLYAYQVANDQLHTRFVKR